MKASLIADAAALAALEDAWWDLFDRCPAATPFRSPAWLLPWWDSFAPGVLRTVEVRRDGRLVALAPLFLEEGTRRLVPLGIGISDDLDMLVEPGAGIAAGAAILALLETVGGWDTLSLEDLPPGAAALDWPVPRGWSDEVAVQCQCPVIAWDVGAPDLAAVLPARKLRKLRMARHRAARRGAMVEIANVETAPALVEHLVRLHALRWEGRGEAGVLTDPRVRDFHAQAAPRLARRQLLHATLLRIEERVVGAFHGLRRGATLYAYLGGFDPAFAYESPGTVLMGHALETTMREGAGGLNLLRGQEDYKYDWGARDRPNMSRTLGRSQSA